MNMHNDLPPDWGPIRDISARVGIADKTIRRYLDRGLIHKEERNGPGGIEYWVSESEVRKVYTETRNRKTRSAIHNVEPPIMSTRSPYVSRPSPASAEISSGSYGHSFTHQNQWSGQASSNSPEVFDAEFVNSLDSPADPLDEPRYGEILNKLERLVNVVEEGQDRQKEMEENQAELSRRYDHLVELNRTLIQEVEKLQSQSSQPLLLPSFTDEERSNLQLRIKDTEDQLRIQRQEHEDKLKAILEEQREAIKRSHMQELAELKHVQSREIEQEREARELLQKQLDQVTHTLRQNPIQRLINAFTPKR
jgi:hypothetical protein